jgi:hypothetical protein
LKDCTQVIGGSAEEAGEECIQADGQKGHAELARDYGGGKSFSATRWAVKEEPPPWSDAELLQKMPGAVLVENPVKQAPILGGEDDVGLAFGAVTAIEYFGESSAGLRNVDNGGRRRGCGEEVPKFFRNSNVACFTLDGGELQRRSSKRTLVAVKVSAYKLLKDARTKCRCAEACHWVDYRR